MSKTLSKLLAQADYTSFIATSFDEAVNWPSGELDRCLASGLLHPAEPAKGLYCEECGEYEDVVMLDSVISPPSVPYLRCGEVGSYRIDPQRLLRWQCSIPQLLDAVFAGISFSGNRSEISRLRLWRLGKVRWAGNQWTVFFGRALHCHDGGQILRQAELPAKSVLFVPSRSPQLEQQLERMPIVIALDTVAEWSGNHLHLDQSEIEQQLADELAAHPLPTPENPVPKRGSRTATIEALRRLMEEHLRTARDHALATMDRTGTPELLPRPRQDLLARQLRIDKSTVTRCLEDKSARELRYLWNLAGDLDGILRATERT